MIKTDKELVSDQRDEVAKRIVIAKLNVSYWKEVLKTAKTNTQEAVDANEAIKLNNENAKKDRIFLKVIDRKLRKMV